MSMLFFWVVTPYGLVGRYKGLRGAEVYLASQPRRPSVTSALLRKPQIYVINLSINNSINRLAENNVEYYCTFTAMCF
jgi:hypothetical protein